MVAQTRPIAEVPVNNHNLTDVTALPNANIVQAATLVTEALNSGRVKINPDGSFTVDGIPLATGMPAGGGQAAPGENVANQFQFDGKAWTVKYDGVTVVESNMLGLGYILMLIQRKGKEIRVTDMVTAAYGGPENIMREDELLEGDVALNENADEITGEMHTSVVTSEFRDEILPDEDRGRVMEVMEMAQKRLAMLESKGLPREVLKLKEEIREVEDYLKRTRFMGKNICFPCRAESDRKSVAKAIKHAIGKIGKKHAALAEHLRESIKTGAYCSYRPKSNTCWEVATT